MNPGTNKVKINTKWKIVLRFSLRRFSSGPISDANRVLGQFHIKTVLSYLIENDINTCARKHLW